jgi:ribosomal protein S18 acetylase RimI-like enzyme
MSVGTGDSWVNRQTETRAVHLTADSMSLDAAEKIYDVMKLDRPHMAARLSKLMPKQTDDGRKWSDDVTRGRVHVWALKATQGILSKFVAIIWFELVGHSPIPTITKKDSISDSPGNPKTAHIEVLWTHPDHRQCGFGSRLVESILIRYPGVTKWTAFTSRDMKKDPGVNKFWKKNGFNQDTIEVGKVNQDGFFIRNSALETTKRRRVQTQIFRFEEEPPTRISTGSRNG